MSEESTKPLPSAVRLAYDHSQQYRCTDCPAKCCRYPWRIAVTDEEHARYMASDWIPEFLSRTGRAFERHGDHYKVPVASQPDGGTACVFLDTDNMCMIQKREGHSAIPFTCQNYPFFFTGYHHPEGGELTIATHTSFFCRSIMHNYGDPMKEAVTSKLESANRHSKIFMLPDSLPLQGIWSVPLPAYLILIEAWQALFERDDLPVDQALWTGYQLLTHIEAALTEADATELQPEALSAMMHSFEGADEPPPVTAGSLLSRSLLAGLIFDKLGDYYQNLAQPARRVQNVMLFLNLLREQGTMHLWGPYSPETRPLAFHARQAKAVRVPVEDPAVQAYLRHYFRQLLAGKVLFCQRPDLHEQYFMLGAAYPLIIRLTRYVAHSLGHSQATLEDVKEAVGLADLVITSSQAATDPIQKMATGLRRQIAMLPGAFAKVLWSEPGIPDAN